MTGRQMVAVAATGRTAALFTGARFGRRLPSAILPTSIVLVGIVGIAAPVNR